MVSEHEQFTLADIIDRQLNPLTLLCPNSGKLVNVMPVEWQEGFKKHLGNELWFQSMNSLPWQILSTAN